MPAPGATKPVTVTVAAVDSDPQGLVEGGSHELSATTLSILPGGGVPVRLYVRPPIVPDRSTRNTPWAWW